MPYLGVGWGGKRCREEHGCKNSTLQCIVYFVTAPFYRAGLPFLVSDKKIKDNIEKLVKADKKANMNSARMTPAAIKLRDDHEHFLEQTFCVAREDIQLKVEACPARWEAKIHADIELINKFLDENPEREVVPMFQEMFGQRIAHLVQTRAEEAVRNQRREELHRNREGNQDSGEGSGRHGIEGENAREDGLSEGAHEGGTEGDASAPASEFEREDRRREKERKKKRKRSVQEEGIDAKVPHNILELLTPVWTAHNISHNAATEITSAFYKECGIDIDDEVTLSVTTSKRVRSLGTEFIAQKGLEDLTKIVKERNIPLTLHYDTKILSQRMNNKREEKERLAVVVSGPTLAKDHLLAIPGLDGGTAIEQAEAAYGVLQSCNLHQHVRDLVYDTPAVNTGRIGGTVRLLQLLLENRACLCCPCRRHIAELLGKFATIGATGSKSSSPGDALFARFRSAWPEISESIDFSNLNNIITTFDWDRWEGTPVARAATKAKNIVQSLVNVYTFKRNDRMHGANFILMFLGVRLRDGATYRLPDLSEPSNARFFQRQV